MDSLDEQVLFEALFDIRTSVHQILHLLGEEEEDGEEEEEG
jgi:hypothetical protein